jgi:hypothetical protein
MQANLTEGNSDLVKNLSFATAKARITEGPGEGNLHARNWAGAAR